MGLAPEECWYVGDMPGIDVVGARRAGLHPVLMDPLGIHHDADYDRCDSLTQLAARLGGVEPDTFGSGGVRERPAG
jgi:FMN phosphatase YigB (HAD superfamily)